MAFFDDSDAREILAASNIGLWRVEFEDGKPPRFYADAVMDELLGIETEVTPEERFVLHHKWIHPDDLKMFEEYSNKLAAERTEVVYRFLHPKKGEMFVRCAGLRDVSTTDYLSFYGTHQDISDTIRYEKEKYAETRLAEAVAEKKAALKKAERASAAKSEFLSRMSHDIRTPLNGLIGILEINEAHADDIELVTANRKKAKVAAHHLLDLINDVLDMSKLEDERVEVVREPLNLHELFTEVLTMCSLRAKNNAINLKHDNGENLKYENVIGSSLHVKRIFMNIITNCVKYNKAGGEITCREWLVDETDTEVTYCFEIADTGIGMSEEFLEHIFEPFTQERIDARSHYQGNGMGMAIVKKLLDKMDGTIEVESKLGEGSKFTITIPFGIDRTEKTESCEKEKQQVSIDGMRILLVEDNELNMEIATFMLEDANAIITTAENGEVAYQTFYNAPAGSFDAIIMDIMMPVLDGYGATAKIRNCDKADAKTIPIIAMTANAFAEDVQKAKAAGMNEHLAKPLQVDVLLHALGTVLLSQGAPNGN